MADSDHIEKLSKCLIKRERNRNEHITNCSSGFRPALKFMWQSHHILPVSAVADAHIAASDPTNKEYIIECLCISDWNVNASANVIGLDTKWPYQLYPFNKSLPDNLPSHLIDHDMYTEESYEYMEANVWDELKDRRQIHKLAASSIVAELNAATDYFKGELTDRGNRNGGTLQCFQNRFLPGMESTWYFPFSMSASPRKRNPGIPNAQHWIDTLFNVIK